MIEMYLCLRAPRDFQQHTKFPTFTMFSLGAAGL